MLRNVYKAPAARTELKDLREETSEFLRNFGNAIHTSKQGMPARFLKKNNLMFFQDDEQPEPSTPSFSPT